MKFFFCRKIIVSTIMCLFLFSMILDGQVFRFKNYGFDSKIPNTFIYTLAQANDGYLWVGTGNGLSRFDGFDFYQVLFPDSVTGRSPKTSLKDKNGTLWFGCSDGTVFYTMENKLKQLIIQNSKSISDLIEGPDGFIYVIPQGGAIFRVNPLNPEEVTRYYVDPTLIILTGCFTSPGNMLIGTQEELLLCQIVRDTLKTINFVDGLDYTTVLDIEKIIGTENYAIGTDGKGLFRLSISPSGSKLSRFANHPELESLRVQSIFQDFENNLWISTFGAGVYQIQLSEKADEILSLQHLNMASGLAGDDVKLVYQDTEGNFWIGFFGDGLSLLDSYAFSYFVPGKGASDANNIIYINSFNNEYFLGTPEGYYLFDLKDFKTKKFVSLKQKTGNKGINSYCIDKENNIWIGTKGNGVFVINSAGSVRQVYRSGDPGADQVLDIVTDEKDVWLATLNGVIIIDKKSGRERAPRYNIDNGLPHNSINQIFLTHKGEAYIATESDKLYKIVPDSGIIADNARMTGSYLNKIKSFSETKDGIIWTATYGNGVFECFKDSVVSVSRANGLMSNYCYGILVDSRDNVWIGHDRGFSRYNLDTKTINVFGIDFAHTGVCNPDGMYESPDGKVFIGTTEGLIIYDRLKDKKENIAPSNNINFVSINDVIYPYKESYVLPYNKRYGFKVSFVGIYFSNPEKVYYSTFMENYDKDWTKFSSAREVPYSLGDGKYKFNLISVNENGISEETPVSFDIYIKRPVWGTWWGILLSIALTAGIIILIIRQRDKAQRKVQVYLEKELAARTSIVMKQKGEIELQNIEITDSINYAKRIQTSILPDINKLKETFKDAFIIFYPRDIVSGDFYWFDKLDDDKFVLVCADSTGHGVPGAFMSIIGSTLLQDIVTRQGISRPSEILTLLDKQIFSTLNKNVELGVSNDGMDMVICEFNLKTRHLRFASAMRPVIIVMDGESYYIRGNRSSVGGESFIDKFFDDQEYYLKEGDIIYMFSDGFPDQFGGADGKKMKISKLKNLIETVARIPMNEQHDAILKFYSDWKGELDQVDDVLMMGVRV